ncbi:hypothetical protein L932_06895 [Helicobacter pylori PZ5026]|nr:hypothetical protein L932_06895 [Helicobacter pylori PZ5026]
MNGLKYQLLLAYGREKNKPQIRLNLGSVLIKHEWLKLFD